MLTLAVELISAEQAAAAEMPPDSAPTLARDKVRTPHQKVEVIVD